MKFIKKQKEILTEREKEVIVMGLSVLNNRVGDELEIARLSNNKNAIKKYEKKSGEIISVMFKIAKLDKKLIK